jgi:hypothetical protein
LHQLASHSAEIAKGQSLYYQGKHKLATEILNKLVYAQPHNQMAYQVARQRRLRGPFGWHSTQPVGPVRGSVSRKTVFEASSF